MTRSPKNPRKIRKLLIAFLVLAVAVSASVFAVLLIYPKMRLRRLLALGGQALSQGAFEQADIHYRAALDIAPENTDALSGLAEADALRESAQRAAQYETYAAQAEALIAACQYAEAAQYLSDSYASSGDERLNTRLKDLKEAIILTRIEEQYPGNMDFSYRMDYTFDRAGRLTAERLFVLSTPESDSAGERLDGGEWIESKRHEYVYLYNEATDVPIKSADMALLSSECIYVLRNESLAENEQILYSYDTDGTLLLRQSLLRVSSTDDALTELTRTEYSFDDDGHLLLERTLVPAGGAYTERTRTEYAYDEAGKKTEQRSYNQGTLVTHTTYDEYGNTVTEDQAYSGSHYEYSYEYNQNGQILSEDYSLERSGERTEIPHRYQYEYDSLGNCLKIYYTDTDGRTILSEERSYGADGSLLTERIIDSGATELAGGESVIYTTTSYEYDIFGNPVAEYSDGRLVVKRRYLYALCTD